LTLRLTILVIVNSVARFAGHFCFEAIGVFEADARNGVFARFDPSSSRHWFRPRSTTVRAIH
jgi:hypothetical protein